MGRYSVHPEAAQFECTDHERLEEQASPKLYLDNNCKKFLPAPSFLLTSFSACPPEKFTVCSFDPQELNLFFCSFLKGALRIDSRRRRSILHHQQIKLDSYIILRFQKHLLTNKRYSVRTHNFRCRCVHKTLDDLLVLRRPVERIGQCFVSRFLHAGKLNLEFSKISHTIFSLHLW